MFAAARDVTELKRFEQTLQQKNVELEDASRMKSEFLANMSHELRTPLNAIIGFSEVLRDGLMGEMTEQQRGFIGDIFSSGKHLLSLINDILDLSKVEAGKMTLDLEPVQVSSLFVNSLSIIREKAATRHIRLSLDAAEELGSIQADPRKVKQIVYNLLSNAVKFTSEGGQVTLRAVRVPRADVGRLSGVWTGRSFPLADNEFEEFLEISVTDSGIGISPEGLEQLFKPFSQIDSGLARKFEGTGLGLAMVKLLAELHGGAVAVESAVGEGSCFTVWLPLRAPRKTAVAAGQGARRALVSRRCRASAHRAGGGRRLQVGRADPRAARGGRLQGAARRLRRGGAGARRAAAAGADHARHHAAQHGRLGVPQPPQAGAGSAAHPGRDHLDRGGSQQGLRARRRGGDAEADLPPGAVRVAGRPGAVSARAGPALKVLVVDDDPKAVELIAVRIMDLASTVLRAYGGREAIEIARRELPDLIVLDLMMPEVNGFDVVEALSEQPDHGAHSDPGRHRQADHREDRARLNGYVMTIMEKAEFDRERFTAEVRRAMSGRAVVA